MTMSALAKALAKGLGTERKHRDATEKVREAWSVWQGKRKVAELVVSKSHVTMYLRDAIPAAAVKEAGASTLVKESKTAKGDQTWKGGTLAVTEENQEHARSLLETAVTLAKESESEPVAPAPASAAEESSEEDDDEADPATAAAEEAMQVLAGMRDAA